MRACENSEVLPPALVAVAVTTCPGERAAEKEKVALPLRPVVTRFWPRKVSPSPKPVGKFGAGLEKSWTVNVFLCRLLRVPLIVVALAEVMTGKFCRVLGPTSGSLLSLGVTPSLFSSMPSPPGLPFPKMELRRMPRS